MSEALCVCVCACGRLSVLVHVRMSAVEAHVPYIAQDTHTHSATHKHKHRRQILQFKCALPLRLRTVLCIVYESSSWCVRVIDADERS